MTGRVDLTQPVDRHTGVDLGGRGRTVTEQLLHGADVGAAVEQVGGEGMTQGVRGDAAAQAGAFGDRDQYGPCALAGQAAAGGVEEQGPRVTGFRLTCERWSKPHQVVVEGAP